MGSHPDLSKIVVMMVRWKIGRGNGSKRGNRRGATDTIRKRTDGRVSLGKVGDVSFEIRREVKLHDNPNISSNKEEEIGALPLGRLQISLRNRCKVMRVTGAGGGLGVRSGDGLEQPLWILRYDQRGPEYRAAAKAH